jgi:hypothetical protein
MTGAQDYAEIIFAHMTVSRVLLRSSQIPALSMHLTFTLR